MSFPEVSINEMIISNDKLVDIIIKLKLEIKDLPNVVLVHFCVSHLCGKCHLAHLPRHS